MRHDFLDTMRADLSDPHRTRALNERLFSLIATQYDRVSSRLSFYRDNGWKQRMVDALPAWPEPICLDLACGTGDITRRLATKYPQGHITGIDLTEAMLTEARRRGAPSHVRYMVGDMAHTGLPAASMDIITGGYALRNAGDLREAIAEIHRLLKPGGVAAFLDFSKPPGRLRQAIEYALLKIWGGLWGWMLHHDPRVYSYIADSLARFPDRDQLATLFRSFGFQITRRRHALGGIIECLTIVKPGGPV